MRSPSALLLQMPKHQSRPRKNQSANSQRPAKPVSAAFDVVAFAASAGGLSALSKVLSALPANFPAGIVVVQHLDPRHRSLIPEIIDRRTPLPVQEAAEGDQLSPAQAYIAPPYYHLL